MSPDARLRTIKLLHTVVWAAFVACIAGGPILAVAGHARLALLPSAAVLAEVLILAANRWRCPLTAVAARYTDDRADNFDIYLPKLVARYNKHIFGPLYALGLVVVLWAWLR